MVGSVGLYFFWGKLGMPPIKELQAQVREHREISKVKAAAKDPAQVAWLPRGVVPHFPKKDPNKKK